ncbi:LysR family transcriptional regulator [Diplocloster agilis]|uniref:LysR family transcriptional regulator n=1 Tax=Diplocloster agilis TaxID=2850323 RepID=A0A949K1C8_9FIRM|nr:MULTISPECIES: LysR family transcriptional regulator [Lachnospiraceae]MBU9738101.1 LysR family transcriptional regulator [Diplocloster agilis]MBU9742642.1 LysR family transcriptional regulator [Diplocloster agilis]MCU6734474.1 LysR family transcriptional regulator [Suonthocola fibrivorans]SCJ41209.1 Hca operon transcriptional activator [uncultured Clostridium sp.]
MELRVLNYFLMVAREENITKAAQLLHVTQPTLSRQLMQLEEELGVKLFQRSNHCIILTEEGMLLKRRAQEMISLAEKTRQDLMQKDTELTGEISIGCGELQSVDFLAKLLAQFQAENPLVRFNIFSGNADSIKERIENGLLDMGLLTEPVDITKYAFLHVPQKETWGVLVHKDSELAGKQAVCPSDLLDVPLMISNRDLIQGLIANWFGVDFDDLHIVCRYNLLYNAAILVRNKIGAAVCIKLDCSYDDTCFIPFSPSIKSGSVLVWKKDQMTSPTMAAFLDYSQNALKAFL